MGFLVNKITGNGTAQTAITNDATLEAVVNSLVAHNTTGGALTFSVLIDGSVIFTESVSANSSYRIPDKINLSAAKVLSVNAATGVNVTVSYLQQAIDVAGALSAAQLLAQQAEAYADRAEAALGTLASPVVTGGIIIGGSIKETAVAMPASDMDLATGNSFTKTITTTTTLTFSNIPASGQLIVWKLSLTNAGAFAVTFPTINWVLPNGTYSTSIATYLAANAPRTALKTSGVDTFIFYTEDSSTVYGKLF